ncbi:MAG: glutamate synthase large chain, partial [Actinomycetota bacterium]
MRLPHRPPAPSGPAIGGPPGPQGLYDPRFEHDACGVAFVVDVHGRRSHDMVQLGLKSLCNLDHRGATGAEANVGDGAGILMQVPDGFFRAVVDFTLPEAGTYAVGNAFLPPDEAACAASVDGIEKIVHAEGLRVLGWREVPVDNSMIGTMASDVQPIFRQVFIAAAENAAPLRDLELERRAFVIRKRAEHETEVYFSSLSGRTLVYKGMLTSLQLQEFYPDLHDERMDSALALVHSRFSTNTFPSWPLAHPYRFIAHNGEINTVQGNRNWMKAREALLKSDLFAGDLSRAFPIITPAASDTASFDETLELLHLGGRSLPHAVLMMIPEAWERHESMPAWKRNFYEFHASVMEPWDGPASIAFTDGTVIGSVLDRNGLRPARYWVTEDGLVVMASEAGVLPIDPATVVQKGRLQPGKMFLVDTAQGRIIGDEEIKQQLAQEKPYGDWIREGLVHLADLPDRFMLTPQHTTVVLHQREFGYTGEELKIILQPMAKTGGEALGSMGTDTPIAVLSERPRLLFDYFSQLFAQVTNPPLDAIREEMVTSMARTIGREDNLLEPGPDSCKQIVLPSPILSNEDLAKILYIHEEGGVDGFVPFAIDGLYDVSRGGEGMRDALDDVRTQVSAAIADGANVIVLSDRHSNAEQAPIPSLLLTSAVHHHLIREKTRTRVALVAETGDAREVHHMALLIGFGAAAINPYLAFETIEDMIAHGELTGVTPQHAIRNYIKACTKGVLKVMSKMGISTVASYTGAQVFEAVGLAADFVDEYFTGVTSKLGGIGLDEVAAEVALRHRYAHYERPSEQAHRDLWVGGEYQWRREGEYHLFNPDTVFKLQHATRSGRYEIFKQYSEAVDNQAARLATLRGLFKFKEGERPPVPIDEVQPVSEIVKRFSTGAMSYGSISQEAHQNLAIAMNRLGGKSNTGEGGEDSDRFTADDNGDLRRSAIKQVASGRFGVTSEYLTNADDLQIKMAQGAKPGEGGQLPGAKVYPWIAKTRHSTPGVGLISPPPHHDIYSIEDLKQLIHDLKNANPSARVHVKLV